MDTPRTPQIWIGRLAHYADFCRPTWDHRHQCWIGCSHLHCTCSADEPKRDMRRATEAEARAFFNEQAREADELLALARI